MKPLLRRRPRRGGSAGKGKGLWLHRLSVWVSQAAYESKTYPQNNDRYPHESARRRNRIFHLKSSILMRILIVVALLAPVVHLQRVETTLTKIKSVLLQPPTTAQLNRYVAEVCSNRKFPASEMRGIRGQVRLWLWTVR
jgi:hypothetical protein